LIGHLEPAFTEACALIADEDGAGAGEVDVVDWRSAFFHCGEEGDALLLKALHGCWCGFCDWDAEDAASGGAESFLVPRTDRAGCGEDASGGEGFC